MCAVSIPKLVGPEPALVGRTEGEELDAKSLDLRDNIVEAGVGRWLDNQNVLIVDCGLEVDG